MKLSEIKGAKALETLADLIDPLAKIANDEEFRNAWSAKKPALEIAKIALKRFPEEIMTILALLDGADPDKYECSLLSLPAKLFEVINDPEIQTLFFSLGQTEEQK